MTPQKQGKNSEFLKYFPGSSRHIDQKEEMKKSLQNKIKKHKLGGSP
jgi:hypothetical protein